MSTRTLGAIAIACSPFLGIDFIVGNFNHPYQPTSLSGVFSLIYMTGWVCSTVALYRMKAAGDTSVGRGILITQLVMLSLGEMWNVYAILEPNATTLLFKVLDKFWPISNCFMIVTGLAVMRAKTLHGWRRFIPFVVGLWLPASLVLVPLSFGNSTVTLYFSSLYSAIAWLLLGISVYTSAEEKANVGAAAKLPALKTAA